MADLIPTDALYKVILSGLSSKQLQPFKAALCAAMQNCSSTYFTPLNEHAEALKQNSEEITRAGMQAKHLACATAVFSYCYCGKAMNKQPCVRLCLEDNCFVEENKDKTNHTMNLNSDLIGILLVFEPELSARYDAHLLCLQELLRPNTPIAVVIPSLQNTIEHMQLQGTCSPNQRSYLKGQSLNIAGLYAAGRQIEIMLSEKREIRSFFEKLRYAFPQYAQQEFGICSGFDLFSMSGMRSTQPAEESLLWLLQAVQLYPAI